MIIKYNQDASDGNGGVAEDKAAEVAQVTEMNEAAKEAGMLMLDRLIGESAAKEEAKPEKVEEAAGDEKAVEEKPEAKPAAKPKKAPAKLVTKAAAEAEDDAADEAETPEPAKPDKPRRKPISSEKIAELASTAAAKAAADTYRQIDEARSKKEQEPEVHVPAEIAEDFARLKEVQRLHAKEYAGRDLAKELLDKAKAEAAYERDWKRKNGGAAIDWDSDEHADFVASNAVDVASSHLKEADRSLTMEAAVKEAEARIEKKYGKDIEEARRTRNEQNLVPVMQRFDRMASESLLEAVRPDLAETFATDPAAVAKEISEDPIAAEAVTAVEQWSLPALNLAVRVINNPESYSNDSPELKHLINAVTHVEKVIASVPKDERPVTDDGRRFSTIADFRAMPESRRSQYYTIRDEDLVPQLIIKAAQHEAGLIKAGLEKKAESWAKRMGYSKSVSESAHKDDKKVAATPERKASPTVRAVAQAAADPKAEETSSNGIPTAFWKRAGL